MSPQIRASRPGSAYGSGRSSTALTTLKIAVLAPMPSMRVRVTVSAKPGWRRSARRAWLKSLRRSPQKGRRNSSRASSFQCSRAPNSSWARRRASSGVMPRRRFRSVAISRRKRTSSSSRLSLPSRGLSILRQPEYEVDRVGDPLPVGPLGGEAAAAGGGEGIEAGAAVVLGRPPFGADQPLPLQPVERGIEGAFVHLEDAPGARFDALGDAPAVHGAEAEGLEDQHVEGALQEVLVRHDPFL